MDNDSDWEEKICILEKDIIIGFMIIRRLMESKTKITRKIYEHKEKIISYPARMRNTNWVNQIDIEKNYFFDRPKYIKINIKDMCNQLLHPVILFLFCGKNNKITNLFVTSYYHKKKKLYEINVENIINIFDLVGNDEVREINYRFDQDEGDYVIKAC
jgi:hypothetical protein